MYNDVIVYCIMFMHLRAAQVMFSEKRTKKNKEGLREKNKQESFVKSYQKAVLRFNSLKEKVNIMKLAYQEHNKK
jgi:hypothetical protein